MSIIDNIKRINDKRYLVVSCEKVCHEHGNFKEYEIIYHNDYLDDIISIEDIIEKLDLYYQYSDNLQIVNIIDLRKLEIEKVSTT